MTSPSTARPLPEVAWRTVAPPAALLAVLLLATSNRYGFHRDELYFRMLHPAWGYVDQPPLTPLLARLAGTLGDSPWQLRLPAVLAAVASVLVLVAGDARTGRGRRGAAVVRVGVRVRRHTRSRSGTCC